MKCAKCGQLLPEDSKFCQYCGSSLIEKETVSTTSSDQTESKLQQDTSNVITDVMATYALEATKATVANKGLHNQNIADFDFGLVPEKPIYTKGIQEQKKYLQSLRTVNGQAVSWNRRGSISVDGINGLIDMYDISLPSGEYYKTIYINMYGADNSTIVPRGFSCEAPVDSQPQQVQPKASTPKQNRFAPIACSLCAVFLVAFLTVMYGIPAYRYNQACSKLQDGLYDEAILIFEDLDGYKLSETKIKEARYAQACAKLKSGSYEEAISLFKDLDGFKQSEEKINEAKYGYVQKNKNNDNKTTFAYLKDLKRVDYKDSSNIFKSLYSWKVTVTAINSDPDDRKTDLDEISRNKPVYFHIKVTGGEPNESVRITCKVEYPDNTTNEYEFKDKAEDGDTFWYGWEDGLYLTGQLRVNFYDEKGNLIGAGSVDLVW